MTCHWLTGHIQTSEAEVQLHMFPLKTLWCREVGWGWGDMQPGATGEQDNRWDTRWDTGQESGQGRDGERGRAVPAVPVELQYRGSRVEEWAQRRNRPVGGGGGGRAWLVAFSFFFFFVPVSAAEAVTKTISSSPKALTASCGRCYCRRQSNTTVWVRKKERTTKEKECGRRFWKQRLGPGRHTDGTGRRGEEGRVWAREVAEVRGGAAQEWSGGGGLVPDINSCLISTSIKSEFL